MKSGMVALVLDGIGGFFCVFIISLSLLDLIFPLRISFILSLSLGVIGCIWWVKIKKSNQKKSNLKKSQLELFSSTMLSMNLYPKEKQLSVIKNLLESKNTSGNANVPNNPEDAIKNQNVNPDVKRNQQDSSDQVTNSPLKDL